MNKRNRSSISPFKAIGLSALGLFLFPVALHATPITISATGTVVSSEDSANYFGLGYGDDTMLGATIVAEFTFDTDDSGPDANPNPDILALLPGIQWISSTTQATKGGVTVSLTPDDILPSAPVKQDEILIHNEYGAGDGLGGLDSYFIEDKADLGGGDEVFSQLTLSSLLDNIITSLDINEAISWTSGDFLNDLGEGEFAFRSRGLGQNAVLNYQLDTFTVSTSASVPEPTILFLLAIGLISFGLVRSRPVLSI